jgi:hypothetical protein
VAGQEIGVKMRQKDVGNAQPVFRGERQVAIHVALGVDDSRDARGLIANQVRGVSEAIQVELLEDH